MSQPSGMRVTLIILGLTGLFLLTSNDSMAAPTTGDVQVAVILTNFVDEDMGAEHNVSYFENLTFSLTGPSMRDYYLEASYGLLNLSGVVVGPVDLTQNSSYYAATGARQREFITEAVDLADPQIDFTSIDAIMVVHPGTGAETTGNYSQLWSIHWFATNFIVTDEKTFSEGTIVPEYEDLGGEREPLGVFVHEFGHELGLPDLYDTDGSSEGIGKWGLMAAGGWLDNGEYPGHMSAWSKLQMGWVELVNVSTKSLNVTLNPWAENNTLYRLPIPSDNESSQEYFLITNRYQTGYDTHLPASGLLIWHIDDSQPDNENESHKLVDLEAADGLESMDRNTSEGGDRGDSGDVWTDSSGDFGPFSDPNASAYDGTDSGWRIVDIEDLGGGILRFDIRLSLEPIADLRANETLVDLGAPIHFSANESYDRDGTIANYTWDLGDGNLSHEVEFNHTYGEEGIFLVVLNVTDNDGLWTTDSIQITVNAPPLAEIEVSNVTARVGENITFSALNSSDIDGTILFWQWNFDDGEFVNTAQANHSFNEPGEYNVSLQVLDNHLTSDITYIIITILNDKPVAGFNLSSQKGDTQTLFEFTSTSYDTDGTIVAYTWDFDDGSNSSLANTTHTFTTPGNYTVTLTVIDNYGAEDEITHWVEVGNSPPVIVLNHQPEVWPANTSLLIDAGDSYDIEGATNLIFQWGLSNGGGGFTSTYHLPTGLEPRNYTIYLNVTDDAVKTARLSWNMLVEEVPILHLEAPVALTLDQELFLNASASRHTHAWFWDFGDGNTSLINGSGVVNHSYATIGTYNLTLMTLSYGGLFNMTNFTIDVVEPPVARIAFDVAKLHQNVEFTLNATSSTGYGQMEFSYRFDSQNWSGYIPSPLFSLLSSQGGNRTLWLKVRDLTGTENISSQQLYFNFAPTFFWYDTPEIPYLADTVTLHLDITDPDDDTMDVIIIWDDGQIENLTFDLPLNTTIEHLYNYTGNYQVVVGLVDNETVVGAFPGWIVIFENPDVEVHEPPTTVPIDLSVVQVAAFPQTGNAILNDGEAGVLGAIVTLEVAEGYFAKPQWVEVAFFVDGRLIGTKNVTITHQQKATVNLNWTATLGTHTLLVTMDPHDYFDDNQTANDKASANFTVQKAGSAEPSPSTPGPALGLVLVLVAVVARVWRVTSRQGH